MVQISGEAPSLGTPLDHQYQSNKLNRSSLDTFELCCSHIFLLQMKCSGLMVEVVAAKVVSLRDLLHHLLTFLKWQSHWFDMDLQTVIQVVEVEQS